MINCVKRTPDLIGVRNVIVSVADKSGIDSLARELVAHCPQVRFYSTGQTFAAIRNALGSAASDRVVSISDYTGQPEMQGGLVKTLDFKLYLGILSESFNDEHAADLRRTGAVEFDLVICNLYPFDRAAASPEASCEDARAHIDIGGVTLLRAAAKNFLRVAPVCEPEQYPALLEELRARAGSLSLAVRFRLAAQAFEHIARYDASIARYLTALDAKSALSIYELAESPA